MIHRCTDDACPSVGQRTSSSCGCHQTDEQVLRSALRKLAAEVGGLRTFESELRAELGNTNWSVLMLRLSEADATLSNSERTDG